MAGAQTKKYTRSLFALRGVIGAAFGFGFLLVPALTLGVFMKMAALYCVAEGFFYLAGCFAEPTQFGVATVFVGALLLNWPTYLLDTWTAVLGFWLTGRGLLEIFGATQSAKKSLIAWAGALSIFAGIGALSWLILDSRILTLLYGVGVYCVVYSALVFFAGLERIRAGNVGKPGVRAVEAPEELRKAA